MAEFSQPKQLDILIVENDPATARLTIEAFKEAGVQGEVVTVPDGPRALAYLRNEDRLNRQPDLILLDLHLPKQSGLELLQLIKSDPALLVTPVVVVSGSEDPAEVREAYRLHANCYLRKPNDLIEFLDFVRVCYHFWGTVVTLPFKPEF